MLQSELRLLYLMFRERIDLPTSIDRYLVVIIAVIIIIVINDIASYFIVNQIPIMTYIMIMLLQFYIFEQSPFKCFTRISAMSTFAVVSLPDDEQVLYPRIQSRK